MSIKIKSGFVLRQVGPMYMAVPIGPRTAEIQGMISLSETGYLLWKAIEAGTDTPEGLTDALCAEYEVTREQAQADIQTFLQDLREQGVLEA